MYLALKYLHALTVVISISLFLWRGVLVFSQRSPARWLKIAPHANDTLLLTAAIAMLIVAGINPLDHPWLSGKILLLLAYIGLGSVALKRANLTAFIAALACFGWIVFMAVSKQVWPI
ncbi:MAG: regulator SirB [Betaproteobacteria bacterium]|jgi:uncharacterized membrane protein SirB2|nr:MAG: regulator SirB [Betaproteobacteria bacterium]